MSSTPEPPELGLREAAERLDVHYMTAYRYVRSGRLPARKVGAEWRVRLDDLRRLTEEAAAPRGRGARRGQFRGRLEARLVAGDEAGAWGVVDSAMTAGAEPSEVLVELLVPALRSIGDRWAAGELSVADEHRASAVANRLIGRLGPRFARRGRKRGTIVVGAAPGDRHGLPSAILADLLRGRGFDVVDLGADTPAESLLEAAQGADRLAAVGISVTSEEALDGLSDVVAGIRRALPGVPVLVGGGAVTGPEEASALGSDAYAAPDVDIAALFEALADPRHRTDTTASAS